MNFLLLASVQIEPSRGLNIRSSAMKKLNYIRGPTSDVYGRAGFDVAWASLRLIKKRFQKK
jgi:hypothetical protein